MHKSIRISSLLFAALLFLILPTKVCAASERTVYQIVQEMVPIHIWNPKTSSSRINTLISEINCISPEAAEKWNQIMDYLTYMDNEMELNYFVPDNLDDSDHLCIVVMGYQLNGNGTMKEELIDRLSAALLCARQYPKAYILCTGGHTAGIEADSEGEVMAQWLIQQGIHPNRLLVEGESMDTVKNIRYSYQLLRSERPDVTSVLLVTSDYHIPCGLSMFETQFVLDGGNLSLAGHMAVNPLYSSGINLRNTMLEGILSIASDY